MVCGGNSIRSHNIQLWVLGGNGHSRNDKLAGPGNIQQPVNRKPKSCDKEYNDIVECNAGRNPNAHDIDECGLEKSLDLQEPPVNPAKKAHKSKKKH